MSNLTFTPLGVFSKLPFEVRERIWLEFAPTGQDTCVKRMAKSDLNILFTSQYLHDEITEAIYHRSHLTFDITPEYQDEHWMTAYYDHHHYLMDTDTKEDNRSKWILTSPADAKYRGFGTIPFDKIDEVTVNLFAPKFNDMPELFCIWKKTTELVKLLRQAPAIKKLTLNLKPRNDRHWLYQPCRVNWLSDDETTDPSENMGEVYDTHMVISPFSTLQNLEMIHLLRNVEEDNGEPYIIPANETEEDLDYLLARDYFWIHQQLWTNGDGEQANLLRRSILQDWFMKPSLYSDYESEFEQTIKNIFNNYPDIITTYDPDLDFIAGIHKAMVCLYKRNSRDECVESYEETWYSDVWNQKFEDGIYSYYSAEYETYIARDIKEEEYYKHVAAGGFVAGMYPLIMEMRETFQDDSQSDSQSDSDFSDYSDNYSNFDYEFYHEW